MLALTRKEGESLLIFAQDIDPIMTVAELFRDGPIKILIRDVGSQVRLGIKAPNYLTVLHNEVTPSTRRSK